MAGIPERRGSDRILFRYHGKPHTRPLGKVSEDEARSKSDQVDYLLMRLKQRLIELPPGVRPSRISLTSRRPSRRSDGSLRPA
jgi:hypothetical protein